MLGAPGEHEGTERSSKGALAQHRQSVCEWSSRVQQRQSCFDWTRRERSADRTDNALADLDVPGWERAVIWTLLTHPEAICTDVDRKLVVLRISVRAAAKYVAGEGRFGLSDRAGGRFSTAAARWMQRGILAARQDRRSTFYRVDFNALADWARHQMETRESALNQFAGAARCCAPLRAAAPSMSEGENKILSFNQSAPAGRAAVAPACPPSRPQDAPRTHEPSATVPTLPEEVWQRECSERQLYDALREWWVREGLTDRGIDKAALIGAVLVCRLQPRSNPQRYVEVCLGRGVDENWLRNARAFLLRMRPPKESAGDATPSPAVQAQLDQLARRS